MSDVNAQDLSEINTSSDVAHLYVGAGRDARSGMEVEMAFFNPNSEKLDVMSLAQNKVLKSAAADALGNLWVHNEPTSELLEVSSIALPHTALKQVFADINHKIKTLSHKAAGIGLKRSYFQELPEKTADELLSRIVDIPRYRVMYAPYRADMKTCVEYFAVCKSNQVSVSYKTQDHALQNVRRLYFLAPFLFLLTDNSAGFIQGKAMKGHAGMILRHNGLLAGRGGILPYVFTAKTPADFFARHIETVFDNPLYMYYDRAGNLIGLPSGTWTSFRALKEQGLNTASNYYLAQSVLWPDVKIAALRAENGDVYGHRYEARMFGVGAHQHQSAFLITNALAFHDEFALRVDELLERFGFDQARPEESYALLLKAYEAARNHGGNFMNIPFGSGNMRDFGRGFADLIEMIGDDWDVEEEIQPLLSICRTGCTDAKVNRILFPTLADTIKFQRTYDSAILENPNRSARQIFEKELQRSRNQGFKACCC